MNVLARLAIVLLVAAPPASQLSSRDAAPASPQSPYVRGVALGLFASDPEWDYAGLVREIRGRGASDVLVVVNGFQRDRFSSDIALRPGLSPSAANIARTLRAVRAAGMRATLMPVVRFRERGPGDWRGRLTPAAGVDNWFAAYARFLLPLAQTAAAAGASGFVVGSELGSLEPYEGRWRALIGEVRARFPGRLTYSANWDRAADVPFWDALDVIGTTAYFPLNTRDPSPSREALRRAFAGPRRALAELGERMGRPVLVTEIGYLSQRGAHRQPWDHTLQHPVDLALQARLYESLCETLWALPALDGFYVWNWFGFGGPRDSGYSPRGKPAAAALARCFARRPPHNRPTPQPHAPPTPASPTVDADTREPPT